MFYQCWFVVSYVFLWYFPFLMDDSHMVNDKILKLFFETLFFPTCRCRWCWNGLHHAEYIIVEFRSTNAQALHFHIDFLLFWVQRIVSEHFLITVSISSLYLLLRYLRLWHPLFFPSPFLSSCERLYDGCFMIFLLFLHFFIYLNNIKSIVFI